MTEKNTNRLISFCSSPYTCLSLKTINLFFIFFILLFFSGCAIFAPRQNYVDLFSRIDIKNIITNMEEQENIASKFYFTGAISINGWVWDSSADIFVACIKSPFLCKMEISHSWGKPLLYLLIKKDALEILDFTEKKHYVGRFTASNLSKFLPDMDYSSGMIWSLLRGYPHLPSYTLVHENPTGIINLEGKNKILMETIKVSDGNINEINSFSPDSLNIKFNDFQKKEEIHYAGKTVIKDIKGSRDMAIKRKKIIFNKKIPDEIFTLKQQPAFEIIYF